jgi:CO/xanthine dehydrogenase Mo-binding subunit
VAAHRLTGEPKVRRMTTVADAGQIVNLKAAHSLMIGGAIDNATGKRIRDLPITLDKLLD